MKTLVYIFVSFIKISTVENCCSKLENIKYFKTKVEKLLLIDERYKIYQSEFVPKYCFHLEKLVRTASGDTNENYIPADREKRTPFEWCICKKGCINIESSVPLNLTNYTLKIFDISYMFDNQLFCYDKQIFYNISITCNIIFQFLFFKFHYSIHKIHFVNKCLVNLTIEMLFLIKTLPSHSIDE
ncbi:hypothetical protein AGLY_016257 [Aphis glycines]|uniref:Uncharacterized protein n=1 Tax=Aphis glycines TaxID=307491 RepID=A0A6G0SYA6_APHGL|nr:hypothetical protein AGLY_016257 [Aphis glycines]